MENAEDIAILLTDKNFQKILSEWTGFNWGKKEEVCREYKLTTKNVEKLRQLWLGLDFCRFEHSQVSIEDSLNETVWSLAERGAIPIKRSLARKIQEQFAKVAAILIFPILLYTAYNHFPKINKDILQATPKMITVISQEGTVSKLVLPDGSTVWLNAGSSVSYPNLFSGNTREISLTGEAYFDVIKNKKMPMNVSVGDINLKVYGTTFNVNAFPSEHAVRITLVEGTVSLSTSLGKFNGNDEFFIEPGQTVAFKKDSKELTIQNENAYLYTAWKEGFLIFKNNTFETILKRLSRKFNVDIELKSPTMATIPIDATFRDENINEILRLLSLSTPFRYYYGSSIKLPDGTYTKSKIYIEEK